MAVKTDSEAGCCGGIIYWYGIHTRIVSLVAFESEQENEISGRTPSRIKLYEHSLYSVANLMRDLSPSTSQEKPTLMERDAPRTTPYYCNSDST